MSRSDPKPILVVTAIVALLAALLLPSLHQAKTSARAAKCKSNLRQLGIALQLYVDTYNKYPSNEDILANSWFGQLMPYALGTPLPTGRTLTYADLLPELFLCTEGRFAFGQEVASTTTTFVLASSGSSHTCYGYNAMGTVRASDVALWPQGRLELSRRLGLAADCADSAVVSPSEMIALGCRPRPEAIGRFISPL